MTEITLTLTDAPDGSGDVTIKIDIGCPANKLTDSPAYDVMLTMLTAANLAAGITEPKFTVEETP